MKILILAALAIATSAPSQACTLSDDDFKALAASPSHLMPSEFPALSSAQQNSVCQTRVFIKQVDAQKGIINELGPYSTKYLTAAEYDRIVAASNAYLERLIKARRR
jgi:hypothetical protein